MNDKPEVDSVSKLLVLSPILSVLSLVCFQMYGISHWHHLRPGETVVTRISDLIPVDGWKLASVVLALAGVLFAFARRPKGRGLLLRLLALILGVLALLTVPVIT